MKFTDWTEKYCTSCQHLYDNIYEIDHLGKCLVLEEKKKILDETLKPTLSNAEQKLLEEVDYIVFKFGSNWWFADKEFKTFRLNPLKYTGQKQKFQPAHLGVHGEFELLNGCMSYDKWCQKARFLGVQTLGICERNTLAGLFKFQKACKSSGIKPVLGVEYVIALEPRHTSSVKLYVVNKTGWKNLLALNTIVKFGENGVIEWKDLLKHSDGLICFINPADFRYNEKWLSPLSRKYTNLFFIQISPTVFKNQSKDREYLENLKEFYDSQYKSQFILIDDTYYLEPEDIELKDSLNVVAGMVKDSSLDNTRHFKTENEIKEILSPLFKDFEPFWTICVSNCDYIARICDFEIETGHRHLPEYKRKDTELYFKTNFDLLHFHVHCGLERLGLNNNQKYLDRLSYELDVIKSCGVVDYFLIAWDIVQWAESNGILAGIGRGSSAGSLVAFLLGITKIDPLKYNLLFERFLTRERATKSLPDADLDFQADRKNEIKKYLKQRYGEDRVCSIGAYTTLQIKSSIKDYARVKGLPVEYVNRINKALNLGVETCWENIIENAADKPSVKDFVIKNPDIVEFIQLSQGQPKAESVHPCATIVLPENMTLKESIPVRVAEVDGVKIIVSEWEGEELDEIGYLKEDILGLNQLTKFRMIMDLVKKNHGIDIDIYNLPFEPEVFKLFREGNNADVFQFNTKIAVKYCKSFQPDNFEDLALMVAICRPGPMEAKTDQEIIKIKFGEKKPEKRPGLEEITKNTYKSIIYQEQVMQACVDIAGISLTEADDVRRALGKKKPEVLKAYQTKFIEGGVNNGYDKKYLTKLWKEIVGFSSYSFNRSHAVVYAMTAYVAQYLKWKYPVEFWTTAFSTSNQEDYEGFISEIIRTGFIELSNCNINNSDLHFMGDCNSSRIYWTLSVRQCGEVATQAILEERRKNGQFFSLKEFLARVPKSKVTKAVVENLIYAGAFDELEKIKNPKDRIRLINQLKDSRKGDYKVIDRVIANGLVNCEWWWLLMQKKMSEYAFFDYKSIIKENPEWKKPYLSLEQLHDDDFKPSHPDFSSIVTAGIIKEIETKKTPEGVEYARILLENNYSSAWFYIKGHNTWDNNKEYIMQAKAGDLFIGNGHPRHNKWLGQNVINSTKDFACEILSV